MKKKRVLFNGLSFFGNKLVDGLRRIDPKNRYAFFDTYISMIDQLMFLYFIRRSDLVVSFNGVTSTSGSMDRVIEYDVPLIMYWHGTDVMIAKQRFDSGSINNKYTVHAHHFTDAEWLQKELLEIGISTELLPFKYVEDVSEVHKYEKISVLTYLAKGKEQFYGLNEIQKLAENFPEVEFTVAGSDGKGINYPKNIQFLGWRSANEMKRLRFNHAIFIRLTEHDGNSLSVLEALASGQEVIWNYPGENCNYVQEISEIEDTFKEVIYKIELRGMISSSQNIDFVKKNHSKETILTNFKNTILRFAD